MGRKRQRQDDPSAAQLAEGLAELRKGVDVEDIVNALIEKAGNGTDVGEAAVVEALKGSGPAGLPHLLMQKAKRARKGPAEDPSLAPVAELVWLLKHQGVTTSAADRLAARALSGTSDPSKARSRSQHFEDYYKRQGVVPEAEWNAFMTQMHTPLPMVMRLSPSRPYRGFVEQELEGFVQQGLLQRCPWGGAFTAAHADFHSQDPLRKEVQLWCRNQNTLGTGVFQEAASMLPPLLLDVGPEHLVLDMCAAPGSKTLQVADCMLENASLKGVAVTGGVLANEIDSKKANQVLPGRIKRTHANCVVVVQSDARAFPPLWERGPTGPSRLLFDRILADVPCSGDGTGRKDGNVWETWSSGYAFTLHPKQLQILLRGLDSLKKGGRLVYSTCSLNPLEDEAVVAAALAARPGEVEVVDATPPQGFKTYPGVTTWGVPAPGGGKELLTAPPPGADGKDSSLYPPKDQGVLEQLRRTHRVLPQGSDTGGFFAAVFVRRTDVADKKKPEAPDPKLGGMRNARLSYHVGSSDDPAWRELADWFGMDPDPTKAMGSHRVLVQMDEKDKSVKKKMFLATAGCQRLLHCLLPVTQTNNVKAISAGARLVTRVKGAYLSGKGCPCSYRPAFEGAAVLSRYATKRLLSVPPSTAMQLLQAKQLPCSVLTSVAQRCNPPEPPLDLSQQHWIGPCLVGIAPCLSFTPSPGDCWDDVQLPCIVLGQKVELTVEDHEREGLLSLMRRVFPEDAPDEPEKGKERDEKEDPPKES